MRLLRGPLARILLVLTLAASACFGVPASAAATGWDVRQTVISTAIAQLGKPYVWAAEGPNSYDCSGLVKYCYDAGGIYVPHQSGEIWSRCDPVPLDRLEPGDLVFRTNLSDSTKPPTKPSDIRHVGIYVGGGQVIYAPSAGDTVSYQAVGKFHCGGRLKQEYWPQLDSTYDQPPLVTGDFTGDKKDDVAYLYGLGGSSAEVQVVPSSGSVLGPAKAWFSSTGWYWGRTKTVATDLNHDGKSDLLALYDYGTDSMKLWAFVSDGKTFRPAVWWASVPGDGWYWGDTRLVAGDFDGDGRGDAALVRTGAAGGSRAFVLRSAGTRFYPPRLWWSSELDGRRMKYAIGDLTGDGKSDLVTFYDRGKGASDLSLMASTGRRFGYARNWYSSPAYGWDWSKTKLTTADLNGDRKHDVALLFDAGGSTSRLWAFLSNGSGFSARNVFWTSAPGYYDWERGRLGTGDFDADGRDEMTVLYDLTSASAKLSLFDTSASGGSNGVTNGWFSPIGGLQWNRVK